MLDKEAADLANARRRTLKLRAIRWILLSYTMYLEKRGLLSEYYVTDGSGMVDLVTGYVDEHEALIHKHLPVEIS